MSKRARARAASLRRHAGRSRLQKKLAYGLRVASNLKRSGFKVGMLTTASSVKSSLRRSRSMRGRRRDSKGRFA